LGRNGHTQRRAGEAGFSQLELLVAVAFLIVATLGFSQALIAGMQLSDSVRERTIAVQAARQVLEEMQDETFAEVFARYDATTANDPATGTSPGATFDVPELRPRPDDPDGSVGEVVFPVIGTQLREDADVPGLGLPLDLNADGLDTLDHAGDYQLLPVAVRVSWRSNGADMQVELRTYLCAR
jgi:type II secretory pathway pseudopilin PulG